MVPWAVEPLPLMEKPSVNEFNHDALLTLSGEAQAGRKRLVELIPELNLKDAVDLRQ